MTCRVVGRWRIVEYHLWEPDYLDLVEPATLVIGTDGRGEIAFGALQAGLDEMEEPQGAGSAELLNDGTLEIEFAFHFGDEAFIKAEQETFSTAC